MYVLLYEIIGLRVFRVLLYLPSLLRMNIHNNQRFERFGDDPGFILIESDWSNWMGMWITYHIIWYIWLSIIALIAGDELFNVKYIHRSNLWPQRGHNPGQQVSSFDLTLFW